MHGWWLSDMVPAQQGNRNILACLFTHVPWKNVCCWIHALKQPKHNFLYVEKGRAVCDGWEAEVYEAAAWQPLHVGSRLFQDLLLRAVSLQLLWFRMVMTVLFVLLLFCPERTADCNCFNVFSNQLIIKRILLFVIRLPVKIWKRKTKVSAWKTSYFHTT